METFLQTLNCCHFLLLSDAHHEGQRLLEAFERAYGISLTNFQGVAESLDTSVIKSLNVACTVRVLTDWQQPAHAGLPIPEF